MYKFSMSVQEDTWLFNCFNKATSEYVKINLLALYCISILHLNTLLFHSFDRKLFLKIGQYGIYSDLQPNKRENNFKWFG